MPIEPDPAPIFDAFRASSERGMLPTSLGTAELRDLGAQMMARNVFTARGTSAVFVSKIKEVIDLLSAGDIGEADARVALLETLKALGYTPERGFPDVPEGTVPPAVKGTLQDLSSFRRLDLIVRTQIDLMAGAGFQYRGHTPDRLEAAPAWELIRVLPVETPRDWEARWAIAGGKIYAGRMIALKGDPVWGELGSSGNFSDALDTDHPPFAFNSGMGWAEISRAECVALRVLGPEGETIEQYHSGEDRPITLAGPLPLPRPSISLKKVDPEIVKQFEEDTKATPSETPGLYDFSDLLEEGLAESAAEYQRRNPNYKPGKP